MMDKKLNGVKEYYKETHFNKEISERIKSGVHHRIKEEKESNKVIPFMTSESKAKTTILKRVAFTSTAAVLLFGLFIGSAFVSPAMAEVAAKIPFLDQLFEKAINNGELELAELSHVINTELRGNGHRVEVGIEWKEHRVDIIFIGSEEEFKAQKTEMESIAQEILHSNGLSDYQLVIDRNAERYEMFKAMENNPVQEELDKLSDVVYQKLIELNYEVNHVLGGYDSDLVGNTSITVGLPAGSDIAEDEIKKVVNDILADIDKDKEIAHIFVLKEQKQTEDSYKENEWSIVMMAIHDALSSQKDYSYETFSYQYKPERLKYTIRTKLDSSDPQAKELAVSMKLVAEELIQKAHIPEKTNNQPYDIIVTGKDDKPIE